MLNTTLKHRTVNGTNKPLSQLLANHVFYYPTPSHLTYNWSFGSLAGLFFALQLVTGIILAMHYTPHVDYAFASVEHIMTDVNGGYIFRYFHANGASAVFILMYLHIARNLYYQSYLTRRVLWYTGVVIFLLMMATAFIGYVLPWGQMSFWGATVITSLVTAVPFVGEDVAYWVWGGFSINNATLTRFFSLHYLLPFLITGLIGVHLVLLHTDGSSDPLTIAATPDKLTFHPYFSYKDAFIFLVTFAAFGALVCYLPNLLGHSDNFIPANPLVTPAHIVPEWYFTPFYAILRACPNKLGGVIGMLAAILLLLFIPAYIDSRTSTKFVFAPYSLPHKVAFWLFAGVFLTLLFLGSRAAAAPYVGASKVFTILYFSYFLFVLPGLAQLNERALSIPTRANNSGAPLIDGSKKKETLSCLTMVRLPDTNTRRRFDKSLGGIRRLTTPRDVAGICRGASKFNFAEWLVGLINGDGYFILTAKKTRTENSPFMRTSYTLFAPSMRCLVVSSLAQNETARRRVPIGENFRIAKLCVL